MRSKQTEPSAWTAVPLPAASSVGGTATITIAENGAAPDLVTVSIPIATFPRLFARLKIVHP